MTIYIILGVFSVWILILSWFVISTRKHYFNLVSKTKKYKIDDILDKLLENEGKLEKAVGEIRKDLTETISQSKFHLQKIGLVRFNPFERMTGEQSFVIALLDKDDNGIIVNFIYTHDGLRAYTKKVNRGKGVGYQLSDEEEKAIRESQ